MPWRDGFASRLGVSRCPGRRWCSGSAAFSLVRIHPYELSYYNELIGGPRQAWRQGFELTYWYDAFTDQVFDDLNRQASARAGNRLFQRIDQDLRLGL